MKRCGWPQSCSFTIRSAIALQLQMNPLRIDACLRDLTFLCHFYLHSRDEKSVCHTTLHTALDYGILILIGIISPILKQRDPEKWGIQVAVMLELRPCLHVLCHVGHAIHVWLRPAKCVLRIHIYIRVDPNNIRSFYALLFYLKGVQQYYCHSESGKLRHKAVKWQQAPLEIKLPLCEVLDIHVWG